MRSLQALCVQHVARRLGVVDLAVERLPELLALEVLRALLATGTAAALRRWALRRPAWHLHLEAGQSTVLPRLVPGRFIEVSLSSMEIVDFEVSRVLVDSTSLKILQLQNCKRLNGRFLADIGSMRPVSLRRLLCDRCPGLLDDFLCRGLQELHLTHLSLAGAVCLTDAVASCLSGGAAPAPLPSVGVQLEYLDLSQTKVSDQGVSTLVRLPLSVLMLSRTAHVTAPCLRQLSASLGLRALMPDRPRVLLRNFRALSALEPALSMVTLDAKQLIPALHSGACHTWPEEAIRHAVQLLAAEEVESRKRPGDALHGQRWEKKK